MRMLHRKNAHFSVFCFFLTLYSLLSGYNHNAETHNNDNLTKQTEPRVTPVHDVITSTDTSMFASRKPLPSCQLTNYSAFSHYKKLRAGNDSFHKETKYKLAVETLYKNGKTGLPNCTFYNSHIDINYVTCANFFDAPKTNGSAVTLVTQLTINRFQSVKRMALKWRGPMSVAVYLTSSDLQENTTEIQEWIVGTGRRNIAVHFMIQNGTYFPINKLRNLALENASTKYIFQVDVDFVPSAFLEADIQREIEAGFFKANPKRALIAIALQAKYNWPVPENKTEANILLRTKLLQLFNYVEFPSGHGPCNLTRWRSATKSYRITYKDHFEPYVVLKRSMAPRYPVQFLQRYRNKISHIAMLHTQKFEFHVLANSFIVHVPHDRDRVLARKSFSCAEAHAKMLCFEMKLKWCRS